MPFCRKKRFAASSSVIVRCFSLDNRGERRSWTCVACCQLSQCFRAVAQLMSAGSKLPKHLSRGSPVTSRGLDRWRDTSSRDRLTLSSPGRHRRWISAAQTRVHPSGSKLKTTVMNRPALQFPSTQTIIWLSNEADWTRTQLCSAWTTKQPLLPSNHSPDGRSGVCGWSIKPAVHRSCAGIRPIVVLKTASGTGPRIAHSANAGDSRRTDRPLAPAWSLETSCIGNQRNVTPGTACLTREI